jgi:hypothetical protein
MIHGDSDQNQPEVARIETKYFDALGREIAKEHAAKVIIREFDANGTLVRANLTFYPRGLST